jgi:hypothetical protein
MPLDRTALARMGKLVTADVAAGRPGPNSEAVSRALEAQPAAALDLLDMLLAEAGKKRRNEKLVTAYGYMLGQALEYARYAIEGGFEHAAELVDAVRQRLLAAGRQGQLEPALLLMVLREFASAKLDPGPELRALMEKLAEAMALDAPSPEPGAERMPARWAATRSSFMRMCRRWRTPSPTISAWRSARGYCKRGRLRHARRRSAGCWTPPPQCATPPRPRSSTRRHEAACRARCSGG